MNNTHLGHISTDKDLNLYKEYLENDDLYHSETKQTSCRALSKPEYNKPTAIQPKCGYVSSDMFFQGYLKKHIGKLVRVESLMNDKLEVRIGFLFEVGANYIVLKLFKGNCTMMIESSQIKYITIIHDNDINKSMVY